MGDSSITKCDKQDETTRSSVATIASQTENDGNIIAGGIELWKVGISLFSFIKGYYL